VDDGGIFMDFFRISQQLRPEMQVMPFFSPQLLYFGFFDGFGKRRTDILKGRDRPTPRKKRHAAWCIKMVPKSANGKHPFLPSTPTRCDLVNCLWVFDVIVVA